MFTYDDAGNLLKDDRYQYTWDGEGRLLSVKDVNGNTVVSFTYRPDGRRETKTVNGVTYHYHYDGSDLIRITNNNGQTVWAFTWASGKPNTVTNQNGNTFYYVTNYRGDVIRIVDENGATVANYSYDPWGKVLSVLENAAVTGQPLGYAGYYYDRETKLHYLQARYYDPETARFISRDPDPGDLDNPLSQNAYIYTENNPVMYTDPNGYSNKWYDLGQGWKARIDSAKGSTQKHVHLYGPKGQHYSQNADGSIHDKHKNSSGEPPKWVKKVLKQKTCQ
ncbi:RHS repeat-associated core domain-containing protein [Anoxybacillus sp. PDR2]|nr:RHS repeat-associated core domain-containing protein [Anoxybacillus sp. PDR2]QHC03424.1 hypothetical protein GRQ40_05245 [Anoxybacillus sp. PDR2]